MILTEQTLRILADKVEEAAQDCSFDAARSACYAVVHALEKLADEMERDEARPWSERHPPT